MLEMWPQPAPLEGVKSKKRAIFELHEGAVCIGNEKCSIAKVEVSLCSRVAAVGKEGRAVADVLLGSQELVVPETQRRHENLVVAHLGSHILDAGALADTFERRPQVVVISQPNSADEPWSVLFAELLKAECLRKFQGAIIFCVDHEIMIPTDLCQISWVAVQGQLKVSEQCTGLRIIDDISREIDLPSGSIATMISEVQGLVRGNFRDFEKIGSEDLTAMAKFEDSKVAVLLQEGEEGSDEIAVIGYLTYRYDELFQSVYMPRIAVNPNLRGRGYASYMLRWLIVKSRQIGHEGAVSMMARPAMQSIGGKLGFQYYRTKNENGEFVNWMDGDDAWMEIRDTPLESPEAQVPAAPQLSRKALKAQQRKDWKKRR